VIDSMQGAVIRGKRNVAVRRFTDEPRPPRQHRGTDRSPRSGRTKR